MLSFIICFWALDSPCWLVCCLANGGKLIHFYEWFEWSGGLDAVLSIGIKRLNHLSCIRCELLVVSGSTSLAMRCLLSFLRGKSYITLRLSFILLIEVVLMCSFALIVGDSSCYLLLQRKDLFTHLVGFGDLVPSHFVGWLTVFSSLYVILEYMVEFAAISGGFFGSFMWSFAYYILSSLFLF